MTLGLVVIQSTHSQELFITMITTQRVVMLPHMCSECRVTEEYFATLDTRIVLLLSWVPVYPHVSVEGAFQ